MKHAILQLVIKIDNLGIGVHTSITRNGVSCRREVAAKHGRNGSILTHVNRHILLEVHDMEFGDVITK